MAPSLPNGPVLPASWPQVLDRALASLHTAIIAADEREREVASDAALEMECQARKAALMKAMKQVDQRLIGLQTSAAQAEQCTLELCAELGAGAGSLHRWLADVRSVDRGLADGAKRGL